MSDARPPYDEEEAHDSDEEEETDDSATDESDSFDDEQSWISWFCALRGNEFFCAVDQDYIRDDFNLSGLAAQMPPGYYDYALDLILDEDAGADENLSEEQHELVECAAEQLYGLIHARFILTVRGLAAMLDKYKAVAFGRCPRVLCGGQPCLPCGQHDVQGQSTVKIYCPKCMDIFFPRSKYQMHIDGAFFGTTFPHLFLLTYEHLRPAPGSATYVPRIFGFRVAKEVLSRGAAGADTNGDGSGLGMLQLPGAGPFPRSRKDFGVSHAAGAAGGHSSGL